MNKLDKQYTDLLQDILDNGVQKGDRTGTGTISVFGRQIRHKMSDGFPLLTTKKMPFKTIVTELLWFLRGDTNIKYLVDNNCHIWDGDAYKRFYNETQKGLDSMFLKNEGPNKIVPFTQEEFINKIKTDDEFAKKWGELGPIYGKQWRSWYGGIGLDDDEYNVDQIANSINLLKTDPDSRRNRVNAWNVGELDQMVLPPCHTDFQVYTRELSFDERLKLANIEKPNSDNMMVFLDYVSMMDNRNIPTRAISLMWNQRSVDTFLGLPFNIASYGLLLEIIAKEVNMVPNELIGNLGDTHLYLNHIEQAKEQIGRDLTEDERYELVTQQMSKLRAITDEDYIKYNIPNRTREPFELPTITLPSSLQPNSGNWDKLVFEDFYLNDYKSHPTIKAPLSN
jgi:thymidylate synthase